jgi:AMP-binding enzyme C-terminal domain/Phosphopantetheine attachment site
LTNERFIQRTDSTGRRERWYNSGDLGMQLSGHTYAYVGRADRQVKIRGYRIEPSEIENRMKQHPGVRDAVVLAADFAEGDPRLVAYVIPQAGHDAHSDLAATLRSFVAEALPTYMVPALVILVQEVPMTANGKRDDAALLARLYQRLAQTEHSPVSGATGETELRAIWADVLALDATDDNADFFDVGGTSFSLISLLARVNKAFNTNLQVDIFSNGATLSALIAGGKFNQEPQT